MIDLGSVEWIVLVRKPRAESKSAIFARRNLSHGGRSNGFAWALVITTSRPTVGSLSPKLAVAVVSPLLMASLISAFRIALCVVGPMRLLLLSPKTSVIGSAITVILISIG